MRIRSRKNLSFAYPTPESGRRIEIRQGAEFEVLKVRGNQLLIDVNGEPVLVRPKCFDEVRE